jgi:YegS/Rv2252/BmrU family lipid kinase
MKVAVILNGVSRKKEKFYKEVYPLLARHLTIRVLETEYSGHAEGLASAIVPEDYDIILAAGGDGTLNQVINGVLKNTSNRLPLIGIIPLGTGNDFARLCGATANPEYLLKLLNSGASRKIDIGVIHCQSDTGNITTRYFINACSMGMGPEVVKRLAGKSRWWGPEITYLKSILTVFFTHHGQEISCTASAWKWFGKARVLAIANGRSFGNQMYIAPDAAPDDGVLNLFIAGDVSLLKFLYCLLLVKAKKKVDDPKILYHTASHIELSSKKLCLLEAEGEMVGLLPATITVLPKKISFLQ